MRLCYPRHVSRKPIPGYRSGNEVCKFRSSYNFHRGLKRCLGFLILSPFSPHRVQFYFCRSSLPRIFGKWCLVESNSIRAPVVVNVLVLASLILSPRWVAGRFLFQIQEYINIHCQRLPELVPLSKHFTSYSRHVHQTFTHLYGFEKIIQNPCSNYAFPLINVCTVALIHCVGRSRTQREHLFGVALIRKHWMIHLFATSYSNSQTDSPQPRTRDLQGTCRTYKCGGTAW